MKIFERISQLLGKTSEKEIEETLKKMMDCFILNAENDRLLIANSVSLTNDLILFFNDIKKLHSENMQIVPIVEQDQKTA